MGYMLSIDNFENEISKLGEILDYIEEKSYSYGGMLDSPYTPSPSYHSWRSIWGKKSIYFVLVCWGGAFPLSHYYVVNPYALDWGCPHPSILLSSSIPTQPYGCVVHLIIIFIYY